MVLGKVQRLKSVYPESGKIKDNDIVSSSWRHEASERKVSISYRYKILLQVRLAILICLMTRTLQPSTR